MQYECEDCGEIFDEPVEAMVDLEEEYGVGGQFGGHHSEIWNVCPNCGSSEYHEIPEEEEEEEDPEDA